MVLCHYGGVPRNEEKDPSSLDERRERGREGGEEGSPTGWRCSFHLFEDQIRLVSGMRR